MCPQTMTPGAWVGHFWRTKLRRDAGAQLLEAALVVSLMLTLIIGMVWMGRAYNLYETITRAAREGARLAVAPSCATCGNAYPSDTEVWDRVRGTLEASGLDPANVTGFTISRNVPLNPGATPSVTGAMVTFGYPIQLVVPFASVHLTTITLTTRVQMREE